MRQTFGAGGEMLFGMTDSHELTAMIETQSRGLVATFADLADALYSELRYDELEACVTDGLRFAGERGLVSVELEDRAALLWLRRGRWQRCVGGVAALRVRMRRGDRGLEAQLVARWRAARAMGSATAMADSGAALAEFAWLTARSDLAELVLAGWTPTAEVRRYCARAGASSEPIDDATPWGITDWATAADLWELTGDPYEQALALVDSGLPPRLRQALQILDRLGATAAAAIVRKKLGQSRGPQPQTLRNPAGLTARQSDVLDLVAEGLTNAEIAERLYLSVRTVDHHVAAILDKLGVASRRDARAFALG